MARKTTARDKGKESFDYHDLLPSSSSSSHLYSSTGFLTGKRKMQSPELNPPNPPFITVPSGTGTPSSNLSSRRNSTAPSVSSTLVYNALGSGSGSPTRSMNDSPGPGRGRRLGRTSPQDKEKDGYPLGSKESSVSLTVNYLPTKFSSGNLNLMGTGVGVGPRRRQAPNAHRKSRSFMPKMGGGVDAFRSGEARMGGPDDDDEDNSAAMEDGAGTGKEKKAIGPGQLKWNKFKWVMFFANLALTTWSLVGLIYTLLIWFNIPAHASIIRTGNRPELVLSTLACSAGLFTALLGWAGILLNNRAFLATYTFLLWVVFALMLVPGYMTYKRRSFNLEGKINAQWSRGLGAHGRLILQNELGCCGYFSPYVEATLSQTCYARSILPGCKLGYMQYERRILREWYTAIFAVVPIQLAVMLAGLLCANHVTYRFGKGMMPKAYRLSLESMAVIMDNYAHQLADQFGSEVASEILTITRSRSNLQPDSASDILLSTARSSKELVIGPGGDREKIGMRSVGSSSNVLSLR